MDNLPKKSDDWTTFSGKYPTDKASSAPPGGTSPVSKPVVSTEPKMVPPPPATTSGSSTPLSQNTEVNQFAPWSTPPLEPNKSVTNELPIMTTVVEPSVPPVVVAPPQATIESVPVKEEINSAPVLDIPSAANPFIIQEAPKTPPAKGGGIRRLLVLLILLVVLLGIGFVAFKIIGGMLAQSKPITLTYWGLWENEQILASIISEYKKTHPKVEIVYSKQSPKQYRERLQAALARGDGPDLFRYHNTWVPMLKDDLAAANQTGYTAAEFQQTFYPVATSDLVIGGKVYGAPLEFDGLGLYYNEDLLRAGGVSPPTTWEEFRQAALTLTVKDQNGQIVTAGAALGTATNIEHFSDILAVMMTQNGVNLKNPTSKEAQDALSFYRLFAEKPSNVWDETLDNSILAFSNGRVAFMFAPSWQVFTIKQINPNLKFQIIPIPQLPGTTVTWASYWVEGVSSKSKHIDAAWEFLKFLTSKESEVTLYSESSKTRSFGEPYSRIDLAETVKNDPYVGSFVRQAPTAQSFFLASRTYDNGINDRMIKYLEDGVNSLSRGVSIEAALKTTTAGFNQVLSSFGSTPTAP